MEDIRTFFNVMMDHRFNVSRPPCGFGLKECKKMVTKSFQDPKVKILIEQMEKSGCPINPYKFVKLYSKCHTQALGLFYPGDRIYMCCNHFNNQEEVTFTMIHELIHAYDHCRRLKMDWDDCSRSACTEIRASRLSGECEYRLRKYHSHLRRVKQAGCVRYTATKAVQFMPQCTEKVSKLAMESAWDTCYNDTKPFDRAP